MNIESVMKTPVVTVEMDDTLQTVKELFDQTKFHHLLVVESGKLYGVVSDRDLLKALSPNIGSPSEKPQDAATLNKKVHQIMTRKPVFLTTNEKIYDAIETFKQEPISCIPIVNEEQEPIGIISWRDLLEAFKET